MRVLKADLPEFPVERFNAKVAHNHVGGHVVADGDHQPAKRLEPHGRFILEETQRAAGGDAFLVACDEPVLPGSLAFRHQLRDCGEHGQLDDACRQKHFVFIQPQLFTRGEVLEIEADFAGYLSKSFQDEAFIQFSCHCAFLRSACNILWVRF